MTAKESFVAVLKIVFLFFSLVFVRDVFFYWDGYSYYMRFAEFLPSLSLAFILWTIFALIFSFILWLAVYATHKAVPKFFNISIELLIMLLLMGGLPLFIKRTYFENISLSDIIGVSRYVLLIFFGALLLAAVLLLRKYAEKILGWLNVSITPLVWLFTSLLIVSVPLSFIRTDSSVGNSVSLGVAETYPEALKRPNIILVTMDALTARDMQLYGYTRHTTPFISEWAKDAVVFERTYSSSNWTTPSVMSLMTGQRPWTHKIWYYAYFNPVNNYGDSLPKVLKDNGYNVYGFIQNHYASPKILGISDIFSVKNKPHTLRVAEKLWLNKFANLLVNRPIVQKWIFQENFIVKCIENNYIPPPMHTTPYLPEIVYNAFLESITRKPRQPLFAWLHLFPPHGPYLPPKPFMGKLGDDGKFDTDIKLGKRSQGKYKPEKQADVSIVRKRYDELLMYSDNRFKYFLSQLAERIDMSNTIIIFSSDHGESFSHGYQGHAGDYLYEQLIHIPLIIKFPGNVKGKVLKVPVEQIDIAPTILELAGIEPPKWMEGQTLLPLINGKAFEPRPVFSMQLIKNRSFGHLVTKGTIAVRDGNFKLIYYLEENKVQLFNLKSDPDEAVDISGKESKMTHRLKRLIEDNLADANKRIAQIKESS